MTTPIDPQHELMVRLAILETKLDAIQLTLTDKLTSMDKRVDAVEEDFRSAFRHERANQDMKLAAIQKQLDAKVEQSEFDPIKKTFWAGIMGILSALGMALWAIVEKGGAG